MPMVRMRRPTPEGERADPSPLQPSFALRQEVACSLQVFLAACRRQALLLDEQVAFQTRRRFGEIQVGAHYLPRDGMPPFAVWQAATSFWRMPAQGRAPARLFELGVLTRVDPRFLPAAVPVEVQACDHKQASAYLRAFGALGADPRDGALLQGLFQRPVSMANRTLQLLAGDRFVVVHGAHGRGGVTATYAWYQLG